MKNWNYSTPISFPDMLILNYDNSILIPSQLLKNSDQKITIREIVERKLAILLKYVDIHSFDDFFNNKVLQEYLGLDNQEALSHRYYHFFREIANHEKLWQYSLKSLLRLDDLSSLFSDFHSKDVLFWEIYNEIIDRMSGTELFGINGGMSHAITYPSMLGNNLNGNYNNIFSKILNQEQLLSFVDKRGPQEVSTKIKRLDRKSIEQVVSETYLQFKSYILSPTTFGHGIDRYNYFNMVYDISQIAEPNQLILNYLRESYMSNYILENKASTGRLTNLETKMINVEVNRVEYRNEIIPESKSIKVLDGTGLSNMSSLPNMWMSIAKSFGIHRTQMFILNSGSSSDLHQPKRTRRNEPKKTISNLHKPKKTRRNIPKKTMSNLHKPTRSIMNLHENYLAMVTEGFRKQIAHRLACTSEVEISDSEVDEYLAALIDQIRANYQKAQFDYYMESGIWMEIEQLGIDLKIENSLRSSKVTCYIPRKIATQFEPVKVIAFETTPIHLLPRIAVYSKVEEERRYLVIEENSLFRPRKKGNTWYLGFREITHLEDGYKLRNFNGSFSSLNMEITREFIESKIAETQSEISQLLTINRNMTKYTEIQNFLDQYLRYLAKKSVNLSIPALWERLPIAVITAIQRDYMKLLYSNPNIGLTTNWIGNSVDYYENWNPPKTILSTINLSKGARNTFSKTGKIPVQLRVTSLEKPSFYNMVSHKNNPADFRFVKKNQLKYRIPEAQTVPPVMKKLLKNRRDRIPEFMSRLTENSHVKDIKIVRKSVFDKYITELGGIRKLVTSYPARLNRFYPSANVGPYPPVSSYNSNELVKVQEVKFGKQFCRYYQYINRLDRYRSKTSINAELLSTDTELQDIGWIRENGHPIRFVDIDTIATMNDVSRFLSRETKNDLLAHRKDLFHKQTLLNYEEWNTLLDKNEGSNYESNYGILLYSLYLDKIKNTIPSVFIEITFNDKFKNLERYFFRGESKIQDISEFTLTNHRNKSLSQKVEDTLGSIALILDAFITENTLTPEDIRANFIAWSHVNIGSAKEKITDPQTLMQIALSAKAPNLKISPIDGSYLINTETNMTSLRPFGAKVLIDHPTYQKIRNKKVDWNSKLKIGYYKKSKELVLVAQDFILDKHLRSTPEFHEMLERARALHMQYLELRDEFLIADQRRYKIIEDLSPMKDLVDYSLECVKEYKRRNERLN